MSVIIPDSHLVYLKEAYQKIYIDYLKRKDDLEKEWLTLEPILGKLDIIDKKPSYREFIKGVYDTKDGILVKSLEKTFEKMSWMEKAEVILRNAQKPLTSNQIIDILINEYQPDISRQSAVNSLPATLSVAAKNDKILRVLNENKEYEYSLK